jgi:hypothetical protein
MPRQPFLPAQTRRATSINPIYGCSTRPGESDGGSARPQGWVRKGRVGSGRRRPTMGGRGRNVVRRGDHRVRPATELFLSHPSLVAAVQSRRRHAQAHSRGRWHTSRLAHRVRTSPVRRRQSDGGSEFSAASIELFGRPRWLRESAGTLVRTAAARLRCASSQNPARTFSDPARRHIR